MSTSFDRFAFSCFDQSFGAVREGLDVNALLELSGSERAEAERMILKELSTTVDSRPIQAAGWLKLRPAQEILKRRLDSDGDWDRPYLRVDSALALYRISPDSSFIQYVTEVIRRLPSGNQWTLMSAIDAVEELPPSMESIKALVHRLATKDDGWLRASLRRCLRSSLRTATGRDYLVSLQPDKRSAIEALAQAKDPPGA